MIRVCIVEDETLVREGLRSLLGMVDDVEVVAEAEDGEAALRIIPEVHPDVVLLDVRSRASRVSRCSRTLAVPGRCLRR